MFFVHFVIVLLLTMFFTAVFAVGFRGQRAFSSLLGFFLILLLATWAVALWIPPFGWTAYGVAWAPFLLIGFFLALILVVFVPRPHPPRTHAEAKEVVREQQATLVAFDLFFWILICGLLFVILLSYLFR